MNQAGLAPLCVAALLGLLGSCAGPAQGGGGGSPPAPPPPPGFEEAIFAAGCFWCAESDFEQLKGVRTVESGYVGGKLDRPTYEQVGQGGTGHAEAIRVVWDPKVLTYDVLLRWFWTHSDPFDGGGQFCDRGAHYRPAIFPRGQAQRVAAEASLAALQARARAPLAVTIEEPGTFWLAEEYHQDFHHKSPVRYQGYRRGCGRDRRVEEVRKELFPEGG
jgi:peptide-methionine (S)-S-oxide reductase